MKVDRVKKILRDMEAEGLEQMIVTSSAAIFYLTGKWFEVGERMIALYLSTKNEPKLVVNELFPIVEDLGVEILWYKDTEDPILILSKFIDKEKPLGIDKNWQAHFLIRLMELGAGKAFVNGSPIIDKARAIKDSEEIELMKKASEINDRAMKEIWRSIGEVKTEKEMGALLGELYDKEGAEGYSFAPIIAYGANGADPHHEPDKSLLKKGEGVVIDIGCLYNHYCSDMTRTVFYGEPSSKAIEVYNIVKEANLKGEEAVKPGRRFCDVDNAARNHIEAAGYGKYFTHRTGHSIGIEVHDYGNVSAVNEDKLESGMIFSVEPGIYLSGDVGVRIEDLVLVTESGVEVLNKVTKDIVVL
ncbi:Xaa-Pro peptidase family protein [Clostridium sp. YIM B02551]|uniref:M24 family metallopeptidase n=1 Tax=Clostridium sp. YIM B02551 TaxID=2910679 RepID=UPI001EEB36EE|nr:aminopeptidase P family protein [Clostridium sp. YIM B02551]